jgi:hypothetical protein
MWESQRDFQKVWEGWEAGFLAFQAFQAFQAFHTLSFPWPTLETCIRKSKLPITPFCGHSRSNTWSALLTRECFVYEKHAITYDR